MLEKNPKDLVRITRGGSPFSIVPSTTSLGVSSFSLNSIFFSQPRSRTNSPAMGSFIFIIGAKLSKNKQPCIRQRRTKAVINPSICYFQSAEGHRPGGGRYYPK